MSFGTFGVIAINENYKKQTLNSFMLQDSALKQKYYILSKLGMGKVVVLEKRWSVCKFWVLILEQKGHTNGGQGTLTYLQAKFALMAAYMEENGL